MDGETPTQERPATINEGEAASRLEALLGAENDAKPETKSKEEAKQPVAGDAEVADKANTEDADPEADAIVAGDEAEPTEAEIPADAPEFWSSEDKARWAEVPAELRPLLQKYEHQRVASVNEKMREAAAERQKANEQVKQWQDTVVEAAQWAQQAIPALNQAFQNKYAKVDWAKLSRENPAEWAALKQEAESEYAMLAEVQRRGQLDAEKAAKVQADRLQESKNVSHEILAKKYPDHFGKSEAKIYDRLANYLLGYGFEAPRINAIHEAPMLEIAFKAMRWDEAMKRASAARAAKKTESAAPARVTPGPATKPGNQRSEQARQASERFRQSGNVEDAAALIEQLKL